MSAAATKSVASAFVRCDHCNQEQTKSRCGRCQLVKYCSPACQKLAWKAHHQYICVAKADPLNQEAYLFPSKGRLFAPVHYAALFGRWETMPQEIQSTYSTALTKFGATPEDFRKLTADVSPEGVTSAYVEGREAPLTQVEYHAMTGTWFSEGSKMTPEDVLKYYENPNKQSQFMDLSSIEPNDAGFLEQFRSKPPQITLVQESPAMGYGICAAESIGKGGIVCTFGGELTATPISNTNKLDLVCPNAGGKPDLHPMTLDPTRYTNLGNFANDGPPNCRGVYVFQKGLPITQVLRATRSIKKGEFIHWTYGEHHPVKAYLNYGLTQATEEEVRSFCLRKLQTAQDYQSMRQQIGTPIKTLKQFHECSFFFYLLQTPKIFLELHLKGVLDPKKTIPLLQSRELVERADAFRLPLQNYAEIIQQIANICENRELKEIALQQFTHLASDTLIVLVADLSKLSKEVPLNRESLQGYLEKARIINAFILFFDINSPPPAEGWDSLLDAYGQLPLHLKNGLIAHVLKKRSEEDSCPLDKANLLKTLADALTLEEIDLSSYSPEQRRAMRQVLFEQGKEEEAKG